MTRKQKRLRDIFTNFLIDKGVLAEYLVGIQGEYKSIAGVVTDPIMTPLNYVSNAFPWTDHNYGNLKWECIHDEWCNYALKKRLYSTWDTGIDPF